MTLFDLIYDYIKKEYRPVKIKHKGAFKKCIIINNVPYLSSTKSNLKEIISKDIHTVFGIQNDDVDLLIEYCIN